jgi:hypothetical protein
MHFTVVLRAEQDEATNFAYGLVFIPCPVWVRGSDEVLNLNPKVPKYRKGGVRRLLETEGLSTKLKGNRQATVIIHASGHGGKADILALIDDLINERFSVCVTGEIAGRR